MLAIFHTSPGEEHRKKSPDASIADHYKRRQRVGLFLWDWSGCFRFLESFVKCCATKLVKNINVCFVCYVCRGWRVSVFFVWNKGKILLAWASQPPELNKEEKKERERELHPQKLQLQLSLRTKTPQYRPQCDWQVECGVEMQHPWALSWRQEKSKSIEHHDVTTAFPHKTPALILFPCFFFHIIIHVKAKRYRYRETEKNWNTDSR